MSITMTQKKAQDVKKPQLSLKSLKAEMDDKLGGIQDALDMLLGEITKKPELTVAPEVGPQHRPEPEPEPVNDKAPSTYKYLFKAKGRKQYGATVESPSIMQQVLKDGYTTEVNPVTKEYKLVDPVIADFGEDGPGPLGFWGTNDKKLAELMRAKIASKVRVGEIEELNVSRP